jgi:hypothetical protein
MPEASPIQTKEKWVLKSTLRQAWWSAYFCRKNNTQDIVNPKVADIENINVSMKKENNESVFFLCQKNKNKILSSCEMSNAHENRNM